MNSAIYEGVLKHHRFLPRQHRFTYRLYMLLLDLDELPDLFQKYKFWSYEKFNLAYFSSKDHFLIKGKSFKESILDLVESKTHKRPKGKILLLTHLRYYGYCFNPVSFYYCYDENNRDIHTIIGEVNNTPWGEQFHYILPVQQSISLNTNFFQFQFQKQLHVSPFMDMNHLYEWRFSRPEEDLLVYMRNLKSEKLYFNATLSLKRKTINQKNLNRLLIHYPCMTLKVILAIHWQALKLWIKRIPIYDHPSK